MAPIDLGHLQGNQLAHRFPAHRVDRAQAHHHFASNQYIEAATCQLPATGLAFPAGQAALPHFGSKRRTIAPEAAFLQRKAQQVQPVGDP